MTIRRSINEHLASRILSCPGLPSLPAVAVRVLELCDVDEVDLAAIADEVSKDPAIAAKLLRMANSASFATRGKVASLTRAVALLGTNATLGVTLSFSLFGARRRADAHGFSHPDFWRRALFSAIAGRALGLPGQPDEEEAFVACLLQDLGMLAMNEVFPGEYGQLCLAADGDHDALLELEVEALEVDHVQVGGLLAQRWNLPERFQEAVHLSHDLPGRERAGEPLPLHAAVYLSGRLADVWTSTRPPAASRAALAAAAGRLGLAPECVSMALQRMAASVPEASTDFDLDLGGPDRVQAVLDEARRLLDASRPAGATAGPLPVEPLHPERFRSLLEGEVERARRGGQPLALVLARAAAEGSRDDALQAKLLRGSLRQTDLLAREGGHFLALLVDTPDRGALVVAERIRARLGAAGFDHAVGLACLQDPATGSADQLLETAQAALQARGPGVPS